jgi:predicted metal-dependent hydrolase
MLYFKPVKNLHLNVLPPLGHVRVTVPLEMNDEAIHAFLATRIAWIKKQQYRFQEQERQTERKYISGETHYYFGKKYRLEVINVNTKPNVRLKGKAQIILTVPYGSDVAKRKNIIEEWYRRELRKYIENTIEKWEKTLGVEKSIWGIRKMKTKWGSYSRGTKRIWFNLELAKKPENCVIYIIVHELIHLQYVKHDKEYFSALEKTLPKWQAFKEELNNLPLALYD